MKNHDSSLKQKMKCDQGSMESLIDLCRRGDERAWHELIELVGPVIFSLCRKSRLSRDESFDIFGQISLDLVDNIASLRSPQKILSFVATMTRRKIYAFYRHMRLLEYFEGSLPDGGPADQSADPGEGYEHHRQRAILMEAVMKLPPRESQLVRALFFDQDRPSYKDISQRMKFPVSSIGPTRARALARLYRLLRKRREEL